MPTLEEMEELQDEDNCTWSSTTQNGAEGYKTTSKSNGNSIFLSITGYRFGSLLYKELFLYYWSSSLYTGNPEVAIMLFRSDDWSVMLREYGLFVRAVCSSK